MEGHYPPQKTNRWKKWIFNAALIFFSFLLALISLELTLHFTSYKYLLTRDRYLRYYYQFDPVKGFDIKPNVKSIPLSIDNRIEYSIWSNELGCFDEPYHGEQQFILLVGDSFTHSFAPFQDKWGTQLEKLLNYRVLKCGVTGYGTYQELEKAKEILKQVKARPQLIIVGYFLNDLSDDFAQPGLTVIDGFLVNSLKYKYPKTDKLIIERLTKSYSWQEKFFSSNYPLSIWEQITYYLDQHLIVVNLINDSFARILPDQKLNFAVSTSLMAFEPEETNRKFWQRHLKNLSAFKELAAAYQAKLLIVIIPTNVQVYPFLAADSGIDLERPNRILKQFFRAQDIDYIDLLPLMRSYANFKPKSQLDSDKDLYWRHNSHWSIKGEHLVGLLVSRYILEQDLIPAPNREGRLNRIEEKLRKFR